MGCCFSSPREQHSTNQPVDEPTTPFREYTIVELLTATDGFSRGNMLSETGGELPKSTYRGLLNGAQQIAVKRFSQATWPDVQQFKEEAIRAGRLRHRWLVSLIGYCGEGPWRLLVAEYMPNATNNIMEWPIRLTVACYIAEAFEYFMTKRQTMYLYVNPNKVLFDEACNPCLSCFSLVKNTIYTPPNHVTAIATPKNMILSFGMLLRDLLSGEKIPVNQVVELFLGSQIPIILDSRLNDRYSAKEANVLLKLASQCLRGRPAARPTIEQVIATLGQVQINAGAPR